MAEREGFEPFDGSTNEISHLVGLLRVLFHWLVSLVFRRCVNAAGGLMVLGGQFLLDEDEMALCGTVWM
jgi:hypothetical protein